MTERKKSRKLDVLVSFNRPRTDDHHFVNLFSDAVASEEVEIRFFSVRNILIGRIDVFSLHWPELMAKGSSPLKQLAKYLLLVVLIVRVFIQRIPVVYTVHNEVPHEQMRSRWAQLFYAAVLRLVTFRAYLNESATNDYSKGCVVLHGAYPVDPSLAAHPPLSPPTVLSFGNVRPYKGVELVIAAAAVSEPSEMTFKIVGAGNDESYLKQLRSLGSDLSSLVMDFRYVEDSALLTYICESSAVMLPYRSMYNSGAALLALSAGRPVVVPRSAANVALETELGKDWVHIVEPTASAQEWALAIKSTILSRSHALAEIPDLSRRSWSDIGELYRLVFFRVDRLSQRHRRSEVTRLMRASTETSPDLTRHSTLNAKQVHANSSPHDVAE